VIAWQHGPVQHALDGELRGGVATLSYMEHHPLHEPSMEAWAIPAERLEEVEALLADLRAQRDAKRATAVVRNAGCLEIDTKPDIRLNGVLERPATLKYHANLEQGSDEWLQARLGLLTASEMKLIITPNKLSYASNDKEKSHLYEILSQRITGYVEPQYVSDDMLRGMVDEVEARQIYNQNYAETKQIGFVTNSRWGFTLGYSPDALVGDEGLLECKSRRQKYQIETILSGKMPPEYVMQVQTGLLVSERSWCDFVTYSAGLPMMVLRIHPAPEIQDAILSAAAMFEEKLAALMERYQGRLSDPSARLTPTERKRPEEEITI